MSEQQQEEARKRKAAIEALYDRRKKHYPDLRHLCTVETLSERALCLQGMLASLSPRDAQYERLMTEWWLVEHKKEIYRTVRRDDTTYVVLQLTDKERGVPPQSRAAERRDRKMHCVLLLYFLFKLVPTEELIKLY